MEYPVIIKELPEVIVASMRTIMPSYDSLFSIVPPMGAEMERLGCECAVPEYCFNIYHDGEYKETDVEMAACVLHKGDYSEFPKAYSTVIRFIEENGYEIIDNPRESYIDTVWNKDSVEEWLTEIQFPIRKIFN